MSEDSAESVSFDRLADSFVARLRKGERPALSEYVDRHPEHAKDIVDLFPALAEMEGLKPEPGDATGTFGPGGPMDRAVPIPTQLGDYRILRLIGQGGMGVVYESRRESLSAHVALKVLHGRFRADGNFLRRFRNEARAAARLHHTNIVPVFDFGDHDGILYYVMQYIPGQGLDRVLADVRLLREKGRAERPAADPSARLARSVAEGLLTGSFGLPGQGSGQASDSSWLSPPAESPTTIVMAPQEPGPPGSSGVVSTLGGEDTGLAQSRYHREVARIGAQVAAALAYAHSLGIIHRDIKPPNLLLDARGNAWVTDFGLAKCEDGEAALTDPGDVLGTLRYMAPERFSGHSDRTGDTYALGASLYEMLALRPAFEANDRALLVRQILNDEPPPLRKLDPRVPRDLETIVRKSMAKELASRYASAAEMAEDLRLYLEDRPLKNARRTTPSERAYRWCRRNPLVAGLGVAAVALLLAVVTVSTGAAIREKKSNDDLGRELANVEAARREEAKQLARAQAADLEMKEKLWEANFATARASRYSGRSGRRFDTLAAISEAVTLGLELKHPPDRFGALRNEAIAALALPDLRITRRFGRVADEDHVDLDDEFERYVTTDPGGRCIVRRVDDEAEVARLPDRTGISRFAYFGPGHYLAEVEPGRAFRAWDLSGPEPLIRLEIAAAVRSWDFRADGSLLALMSSDGSISTYRLPEGRKVHSLKPGLISAVATIRLHPWAPFVLVTAYPERGIEIRHLATGATTFVATPWASHGSYGPAWTDDGRRFAASNGDGGAFAIYDFDPTQGTADLSKLFERPDIASGLVLRFNSEGDRLIARGWASCLALFNARDGRCLFQAPPNGTWDLLSPHLDRSRRHAFPGREGEYEPRHGIWSIAEGRESPILTSTSAQGQSYGVTIDPDGRIAASGTGQRLTFYEIATGRDLGSLAYPAELGGPKPLFVGRDSLLIAANKSVTRWPVREDPAAPGTVLVGPPERVDIPGGFLQPWASRDGGMIVMPMADNYGMGPFQGGWIWRRDRPGPATRILTDTYSDNAAISPDGRWVAFGVPNSRIVVHEVASGTRIWTSPTTPSGHCRFSPGGEWLATTADGGRIFRVGTWETGPRLGAGIVEAFSPGDKAAFLVNSAQVIRMVETTTGRELARFEDPDASFVRLAVTPDGSKLLATHKEGLRVWDLRLIRSELSKIGLDWEAPAFPLKPKPEGLSTVEFIGTALLDSNSVTSRTSRLLTSLLTRDGPDSILALADELIQSGWHGLGLAAYDASIRRQPASGHFRMHRGMELFRRGQWEAAAEDFRLALAGEHPCKFRGQARIRLACAYHELGKRADAASTLARELDAPSVTWNGDEQAGLRLLLAEFLDLDGKPDLARKAREAAALHPRLAEAANNLAWGWLVRDARSTLGDNERNVPAALFLARKAVELKPGEAMYGNTYGLALYRAGRIAEARSVLEANLILGKDSMEAWDLFPLAMCQHRLGDPRAARDSYDRAVAWWKGHANNLSGDPRELADLQAEAERLFGATN